MKPYGYSITGGKMGNSEISYGVVNEHAVRASAGIMFALGMMILANTYYTHNITLAIWGVGIFFCDFFLRVVFGPQYSPIFLLGTLLVSYRKPEYVGALQKRFAWMIGLIFSGIVFILLSHKIISGEHAEMMAHMHHMIAGSMPISHIGLPFWLCVICLIFMWLEVSLGFCVGCTVYKYLIQYKILKKEINDQKCADDSCSL